MSIRDAIVRHPIEGVELHRESILTKAGHHVPRNFLEM